VEMFPTIIQIVNTK
jgi:hypothetical protein